MRFTWLWKIKKWCRLTMTFTIQYTSFLNKFENRIKIQLHLCINIQCIYSTQLCHGKSWQRATQCQPCCQTPLTDYQHSFHEHVKKKLGKRQVDARKYLMVIVTDNLSRSTYISQTCSRANATLSFLWYLKSCPQHLIQTADITDVRWILEYFLQEHWWM